MNNQFINVWENFKSDPFNDGGIIGIIFLITAIVFIFTYYFIKRRFAKEVDNESK